MEIKQIIPPITGFLEVELDQEIVNYLWKMIEKSNLTNIEHKSSLIGNISKSFKLADENNYFYKEVCVPLTMKFRDLNEGRDPTPPNVIIDEKTPLLLNGFWVNYQYQYEFNPYHNHGGIYSFAIWLKIPYAWESMSKLSQFNDMREKDKKPGNFEFEYIDSLGNIRTYVYRLSPSLEGKMLFFPAGLRHCVYPFYGTKEPRVSIAGNLALNATTLG